jgi:UDP-N-acetylmuramate dehydrogenase
MAIKVEKKVPLKNHTTLGVGGEAEFFVTVTDDAELVEAVAFAKEKALPLYILGGGSNALVSDKGLKGLVIKMASKGIKEVEDGDITLVTAEGGEDLDDVVAFTVEHGLYGIENLSYIPGTVGASPVQNVGAYGVEVKDVLSLVRVLNTETGLFEELSNSDCKFSYRDSLFKTALGKKYVVTQVTFALSLSPLLKLEYKDLAALFPSSQSTPSLHEVRDAVIAIRAGKFPNWREIGTAGSFFKNPTVTNEVYRRLRIEYPELPGYQVDETHTKLSLGWILDKVLQVRGYTEGKVATYEKQALVLTAQRGATGEEITKFADAIIEKIKNKIGVEVEWEVTKME